jgi:hypothetical protein
VLNEERAATSSSKGNEVHVQVRDVGERKRELKNTRSENHKVYPIINHC